MFENQENDYEITYQDLTRIDLADNIYFYHIFLPNFNHEVNSF